MKITGMLTDVLRSALRTPNTRRYPMVQTPAPARLRGRLHYTPAGCTGCQLCTKDCPADAIELITIDKAAKRFVLRYDLDRCTFCGQCVESCRFDCIQMANGQWELADLDKQSFTIYYGDEADIKALKASESVVGTPEKAN